ncbi:TerC family protein [Crocosphaera chwakensis]|nr:DUF475 domain-containing protein [Crocosphaera chwakensis]
MSQGNAIKYILKRSELTKILDFLSVNNNYIGLFNMEIANTVLLVITLSFFEIILSLDNAVALSSITEELNNKDKKFVLDLGMFLSYFFRIVLIFCATWIIRYWQLKLLAAIYLFYLVFDYFWDLSSDSNFKTKKSLMSAIVAVVFTDLAFSLDSVSAAVGISDRFLIIIAGCGIGVLALRFLTELFQVWMEKFTYLELSGYLAIGLVAIKLLIEIIYPSLVLPESIELLMVISIFSFGFSKQNTSFTNV